MRVNKGELVTLRLMSADVHHRFYAPELGIGPIDVEPGHTESVQFRPDKTGVFKYFCTSICGECHFYMTGWIVVTEKGQSGPSIDEIEQDMYCHDDLDQPVQEDMIVWGQYLYKKNACITCHGENAQGGVKNFNYSKATIPGHANLAENFNLEEPEDAEAFIELLKKRTDLEQAESETDIPQFRLVLTKYNAAKELIRKGKHGGKLDKNALAPPLNMPSWQEILSDRDIDSIIAYLLSIYPWEDEQEFEDFQE